MMMAEKLKGMFVGIDWIRAGQVLGVPALGMLILLAIGYQFVSNQAVQANKDSETRQELLKELVTAQIDNGRATAVTLVRMNDTVAEMKKISEQSTKTDAIVVGNQEKIIKQLDEAKRCNQCLIDALDRLGGHVKPPVPLPAPDRPRGPVTANGKSRGPT